MWRDISIGVIALANGSSMRLTLGLGSGLSHRSGDPKSVIWAIADRGPNLKIKPAIERYGLEYLKPLKKVDGAKIMPRPDVGPAICQLRLDVKVSEIAVVAPDRLVIMERISRTTKIYQVKLNGGSPWRRRIWMSGRGQHLSN